MAKCKRCKTNIPEGTEYCKDCQDKENAKSNESYLDSLLNSVKNTAPATESIYKKKNDSDNDIDGTSTPIITSDEGFQEDDMFQFNPDEIEEFDQFNMDEDLEDIKGDFIISDTDLFGEELNVVPEENLNQQLQSEIYPENDVLLNDQMIPSPSDDAGLLQQTSNDNGKEANISPLDDNDFPADNVNQSEIEDNGDSGLDTDLNDLLNQLSDSDNSDTYNSNTSEGISDEVKANDTQLDTGNDKNDDIGFSVANAEDIPEISDENQPIEEDDFLSLLNQISSDDPVSDDVKVISDLMKEGAIAPSKQSSMPSDVGEVFSDALKAVSGLDDPNLDEEALLGQIPEKKAKKKGKGKKSGKASKSDSDEVTEQKPKISLFKRLFGNVEDKKASKKGELSLQGLGEDTISPLEDNAKPKKGKKGKKGKAPEEEQDTGGKGKGKGKADEGEEADEGKGKKKKKKEKKNKAEAAIQVIDEIDEDVGRINRLGATIVFVFFGLMALLIYVGSNAITYTLNIEHATSYFNKQKYTQAYDQVYGMKIEDDDVEIYSKIMTIMFVNKQLNSYNNYCAIKEYPQALDSLLKGLKRYDKYIELAKMFSIEEDMNYVRDQILAELKNKFKLSEEDAVAINKIDNMKDYSLKVYEKALQNE